MIGEATGTAVDEVVARIVERERSTRRRVLLYTGIPVTLALMVLAFVGVTVYRWQREVTELKAEAARYQKENEAAKARIKELESERQSLQKRFESSVEALPVVREAIREHHKGHYESAVRLYDEALAKDPDNSYVLDLRGYTLMRAGRDREAVSSLERSVAADPHYARGYFNLTKAYCSAKDAPNASRAATRAVSLQQSMKETMKGDPEFQRLCRGVLGGE